MADASVELRILARLGLTKLAISDQLALLLKRFRVAQLRDLDNALGELPPAVVAHIEAHFDRKLDVKDELERYVQDLLKMIHLLRHHQINGDAQGEIEALVAALGDGGDRALLIKMVQALGGRLTRVLSAFCLRLPHVKLQQDFFRLFAAPDCGIPELKTWMQWLDSVKPHSDHVVEFLVKCATERCLAPWLKLLHPLASTARVDVINKLTEADAALVKQIGRFHDVSGLSVAKLLELCDSFHEELPMLLSEFPMASMLTLYAKFNHDQLIASVVKALYQLGKTEVICLVDALALQENLRAIHVFFTALVEYDQRRDVIALFLSLPKPAQSRLLALTLAAAGDPTTAPPNVTTWDASTVFHFILHGRLRSVEEVLRKLCAMPDDKTALLIQAMRTYIVDELVLLGEGIDALSEVRCLAVFFHLFDVVLPMQRSMLVDWVLDVPGDVALPLYDKLVQLHEGLQRDKAACMLQMMASLNKSDKHLLCSRLLRVEQGNDETVSAKVTNESMLAFLCECDPTRRHKCIKLLDTTDHASYDTLLYLLRTQRMPEQVALTKVMLSLPAGANGRLLAKLHSLDGEALDEFFQLLMLVPKVEYRMLARLLVSQEVTYKQFQDFAHVAANMMNQAASREMVIFAAELPPRVRNLFFEMLAQCSPAEKGVVMRIVACSTRLAPEVMQQLVELLIRISWETRSALVEQIRALEDVADIQTYVVVLRDFDEDVWLPRMIHLLNLLPVRVRISLVALFGQMEFVSERVQSLSKLDAMRKDQTPRYCETLCDPLCLSTISGAFLRMFGYLRDELQMEMLQFLQLKVCWVFIEVLTVTIDAAACIEPNASVANASLVNGLAASLTVLKLEVEFVLLGDVMEEAMGNGIQLTELIVVLAHFRDRERLMTFLRYVGRLTRFAPSTLFFRVLSRSQSTSFLFEMCHVLDLDDALFALKRLERMRSRDSDSLDSTLIAMAQRGAAVCLRDEFCHFVLGYDERAPVQGRSSPKQANRCIAPRRDVLAPSSTATDLELLSSDDPKIDSTQPTLAPRPVPVGRQLKQMRDKQEDARRRRHCRNWREWTHSDWDDLEHRDDTTVSSDRSVDASNPSESSDGHSHSDALHDEEPSNLGVNSASLDAADTCAAQTSGGQDSETTLPPIKRPHLVSAESSSRLYSGDDRVSSFSVPDRTPWSNTKGLTRSESAPSTLRDARMARAKLYRGLHAALRLDEAVEHHAPRNRGANIFQKQCEHELLHGPSRIRVPLTEKAHAKVLAARVDNALGRRMAPILTTGKSSLLRSDRHTIELAALAIAQGQQTRSLSPIMVSWIHKSQLG